MNESIRLEALKLVLKLYDKDFDDYREILFVANEFAKYISTGEVSNV